VKRVPKLLPLLALLAAAPAAGQGLSAELFASQVTYAPFGAFASETGLGAALTHASPAHRASLAGGQGLAEGGATWGALSLDARTALVRAAAWTLRLEGEGSAFAFVADGGGGEGQGWVGRAGPVLGFAAGGVSAEAGASMGGSGMRWQEESWSRSAPELRARLGLLPAPALHLGVAGRSVHAAEGVYAFVGGDASWAQGGVGAWARGGRWFGETSETEAAVGAWAPLGRGAQLHLSFQQTAPDPLLLDPPRRGWSLSLVLPLGGSAVPAAAVPLVRSGGGVTFRVSVGEAPGRPFLLGDFTGWEPLAMRREGGFWVVTVQLPRGVYLYAYRTEDGRVFLPASVEARRPDGFGGENGVLVVP
jgi:hypothetical protein